METVKLDIGSTVALSSGAVQDNLREVEFVGEKLAERREFGYSDRTGGPTDTRGVNETLYKTEDGRYIVYVEDWSRWQGEPNTYSLHEVSEDDLDANGRFEALGHEAGMGRSLTLDEALDPLAGLEGL